MTNFQPSPVLVMVGLSLYLLPSLIAMGRRTPHFETAFAINLLLGWTIIGWMYSLAWAAFSDRAGESQGELKLIAIAQAVENGEHARGVRHTA